MFDEVLVAVFDTVAGVVFCANAGTGTPAMTVSHSLSLFVIEPFLSCD